MQMLLSFRFWDHRIESMRYDLFINNRDEACEFYENEQVIFNSDEVSTMQYVGCDDANGTNIFEGDYLKTPQGIILVEGIRGFWILLTLGSLKNEHLEVVGNIFENPELSIHVKPIIKE